MLPTWRMHFTPVKKLVYDENKITMHDLKMALSTNYGKGLESSDDVAEMVSEVASAMKSAGQPVGEKEVAAILKTVVAATESEQVKKRNGGENP